MRGNVDAGPAVPNMVHSEADYAMVRNADGTESPQRIFRRHKTLPRPGTASSTGSRSSSPARPSRTTQLRRSRYRPAGPEPPPTPPTHSRTSSSAKSMQSIDQSSPTNSGSPLQSTDNVQHVQPRPPTTPPNQRTPPTPNLTPERIPPPAPEPPKRPARPQLQVQTQPEAQSQFSGQSRPRPRLLVDDRMPSKATTVDSRSESFKTAPEAPITPEDEDDGKSTVRPEMSSRGTSRSTIRQANRGAKLQPQTVGLGIDIGVNSSVGDGLTPAAEREVQLGRDAYEGGWGGQGTQGGNLNSEEEVVEEWDENLERNVIVSRRRAAPRWNATKNRNSVFMEPPTTTTTITPTTAAMTRVLPLRAMNLEEQQRALPRSEPSTSGDTRRFSTTSNQSATSTIMGTIVVGDDTGSQRRNTLRHVRKPTLPLRDSVSDLAQSTTSFAPAPAPALAPAPEVFQRRPQLEQKSGGPPRESYFSTTSTSSRKARRDVWKTGSIPVVIVPERRTSLKSNGKPPSLRSMSSRRSKRSQSLSSVGRRSQASASNFTIDIYMDQPRRSRNISESDRSRAGDPRTADFPPYIPRRSSSLSATTSRNVSRTGSLTAESLRAHDALYEQQKASQTVERAVEKLQREKRPPPKPVNTSRQYRRTIDGNDLEPERRQSGTINIKFSPSIQSSNFDNSDPRTPRSFPADHNDDGGPRHSYEYNKRNSVQHTPFSQASVETGASHAEVSEARAIPIYPHQNKSVMIVNHSNKPSEASSSDRQRSPPTATPIIAATDAEGNPITPPQDLSRGDENFSPLRNPRAPPKPPPAINFIPATPSGLTPTTEKEKELGSFYDDMPEPEEPKPESGFAMLRRKLSRRRTSETTGSRPGFLTRTFSLSKYTKNYESDGGSSDRLKRPHLKRSFTADDAPVEPDKLHPDWRPSYQSDFSDSGSEDEERWDYPPIDNRPQRPGLLPKRSLSQRMKKAFAIMPLRNGSKYDASYSTDSGDVPDQYKRTIRRTPSGSLRVMKIRQSLESMAQSMARPSISSERPTRPSISSPSETPRPSISTEAPPRPSISPDSSSTRPSMSSENPRFYPPRVRRNYGALFQRQPRPPPAVSSAAPPLTPSSVSTFATGYSATSISPPTVAGGPPQPPPMKRRGSLSEKILPVLNEKVNIVRRLSEKRKEKKRDEMRKTISHPRVVRDGLGEVIKHDTGREIFAMNQGQPGQQPGQQLRQSPPAMSTPARRGSPPRIGRGSPI
ncbi:hypothetical protein SMACR_04038 [Sordaria macrospora]|uniref:WGS project CABT00000000 data, contig 2.17 n=2 Tax=Sordaria macrospora TaxID=5147 RepID=F7W0N5_SORMK|nr:uncharacterized protein SMAC_04038 [Sordaria macrospora k-hell]KAA8633589.1 hypothetical protein SMACR_04038 [Sordaria macrospora]WPJ60218.1 hypothetical protein SMAC4_04038 [Sordaria macrospora]CCC11335.1 unnamed protein product [Sordaria macrospora k-hell]